MSQHVSIGAISPETLATIKSRFDIKHLEEIDFGEIGTTYDTKDGRVLKITKDPSEAFAMSVVQKHPSEHIVPVDAVVYAMRRNGKDKVYIIIMEKLYPLHNVVRAILARVCDHDAEVLDEAEVSRITKMLEKMQGHYPKKALQEVETFLRNLSVDLLERGIAWRDLTPSNVMETQDGRLQAIDLGDAIVPAQQLESVA
jgi:hypothetical protein